MCILSTSKTYQLGCHHLRKWYMVFTGIEANNGERMLCHSNYPS